MELIDRGGSRRRPVCRDCHKPGRARKSCKPNWICARCFDRAVRHAMGRLRRVRRFPLRRPLELEDDVFAVVNKLWQCEVTRIFRGEEASNE